MFNTGGNDEHVSSFEWVILVTNGKDDITLEQMYCYGSIGTVRRKDAADGDRDEGEPKRSFLYDCTRSAPMPRKKRRVDHQFVLPEMMNEHVSFKCPLYR